MRWSLILILTLIFGFHPGSGFARQKKAKPAVDQAQKNAGFEQLFASVFATWDSNHDGKLDLKEVNAAIDNPAVQANASAVAAVLHQHLLPGEDGQAIELDWDQLAALADDPEVQKLITRRAWHIHSFNHTLFLADDPNLENFHQGGMGDCYLLATIGALVYQRPQVVRSMIEPTTNGGFKVQFADGKLASLGPMTDGELILGASEGQNRGYWLSVLEKAYAELRKEKKEAGSGHEYEDNEMIFADFIGHGGTCGPVIAAFTGHQSAGAPVGRWYKKDPQGGLEKANALLTSLASRHVLMTVGTGGDKTKVLPKGIPHKHALGVLNYDPASQMVTVFNPWGNHVKPNGLPGLVNGYPTEHGVFQVPLVEFVQIFGGITYESDKRVASAPAH